MLSGGKYVVVVIVGSTVVGAGGGCGDDGGGRIGFGSMLFIMDGGYGCVGYVFLSCSCVCVLFHIGSYKPLALETSRRKKTC